MTHYLAELGERPEAMREAVRRNTTHRRRVPWEVLSDSVYESPAFGAAQIGLDAKAKNALGKFVEGRLQFRLLLLRNSCIEFRDGLELGLLWAWNES